jgi:hypothetical protein
MEKRTSIDFSKHELIVKEDSLCKIHWLKQRDTMTHNVMFIHVEGILIVKGDFGRWSFCRDFDPERFEKKGVSDSYWCEKIKLGSEQEPYVYDSEAAEQSINEKIDNLLENSETDEDDNVCFEDEEDQEKYDFWNDLLNYCNDDFELTTYFRDNKPISLDFEDFPSSKKQHRYLDAIFDAFEEIINRYENATKDNE